MVHCEVELECLDVSNGRRMIGMDMFMTVMMYFLVPCLHGNACKFVRTNDSTNFQECILATMKPEICMNSPFCDKYSGNAIKLCNCAAILITMNRFRWQKADPSPFYYPSPISKS